MCERFEDTLVIQIVASYTKILYAHHWKDTPEPKPTITKVVLLWLLSKTIVNVSYYIFGHVPRTISVPCGLFLKKGGTISCVVTGPHQPQYSRDLEKLLRDQQHTYLLICMCPFLTKYTYQYLRALISILSHHLWCLSRAESP